MKMSIKKRLVLGAAALATVGAVATLVAGVTFGVFDSTAGPVTQNFTTGTLSLTQDASTTCPVTATNLVPGDSGSCVFIVDYTGSVEAWVSLTTVTSDPAPDLAITITDNNSVSYAINGTHLYVGVGSGGPYTFTVNWNLPITAGNANQGKSASVELTAIAAQQTNNGTCTTPGLASCTSVTW